MNYRVEVGKRVFDIAIEDGRDKPRVSVGGREVDVEARRLNGAVWSLVAAGRSHRVRVQPGPDSLRVEIADASFHVRVRDERELIADEIAGGRSTGGAEREVRCVMPGVVTRVVAKPGDAVVEGQALLYVEAMKMENEVRARAAGRIKSVRVKPGESVAGGQVLVELEA